MFLSPHQPLLLITPLKKYIKMKDEEQNKHDKILAWASLMFGITLVLGFSIGANAQSSQQSGTACVNGSQYCENNSLDTVNSTTTNNTNSNTNINTSTSTSSSSANNVNSSTNVNTNSSNNVNVNSSNNVNTNSSNNVNVNTSTSSSNNVNNSTVNSTVNQTVNNNNTSVSSSSNQNTNVNQSTSSSDVKTDNKNVNMNDSKSDNTNRNINESNSTQTINQNVKSKAPPASAIAPSIMSYSQDLCQVGRSSAVQGQIFGFSGGKTVVDKNCERLKLSTMLYNQGMKVAAVSLLCQDERVFKAMSMAGTPCPIFGKIGKEATAEWQKNPTLRPDADDVKEEYIAKCTYDSNPNREKINKDIVGAVKVIYTRKTKSRKQCSREFFAQ